LNAIARTPTACFTFPTSWGRGTVCGRNQTRKSGLYLPPPTVDEVPIVPKTIYRFSRRHGFFLALGIYLCYTAFENQSNPIHRNAKRFVELFLKGDIIKSQKRF
jgi:hypothetical protein